MAEGDSPPPKHTHIPSLFVCNRALQRHIADRYLADDIKFTHMLGDVQGREALYGVYRAAVTGEREGSQGFSSSPYSTSCCCCCHSPMHLAIRIASSPLPPTHTHPHTTRHPGIDYRLQVVDIVLSPEECKAACWVDLNIKLAPLYLKRYHAPTIVMLRWRHCEDGL